MSIRSAKSSVKNASLKNTVWMFNLTDRTHKHATTPLTVQRQCGLYKQKLTLIANTKGSSFINAEILGSSRNAILVSSVNIISKCKGSKRAKVTINKNNRYPMK
jgi:hypothetical protein